MCSHYYYCYYYYSAIMMASIRYYYIVEERKSSVELASRELERIKITTFDVGYEYDWVMGAAPCAVLAPKPEYLSPYFMVISQLAPPYTLTLRSS